MSLEALFLVIKILVAVFTGLYLFIFYTKFSQSRRTRGQNIHMQAIRSDLESLLKATDNGYGALVGAFITAAGTKMREKSYRLALETVFLEYLEISERKTKQRLLAIAYDLGLPQSCLCQIKGRSGRNVAFGCRKAGLYEYGKAVPDMLNALDIMSSDVQFQILMGLSRIGDVSSMVQAFGKISGHVIVNERAVFEILLTFSGDKYELYRRMIHHDTEYIAMLFLKSVEQDVAKALASNIVSILSSGGKEMRIAAIKAIGKIGEETLACHAVKALSDADWEVRAISAKMLGTLDNSYARDALFMALHDSEWWVRQNAAAALVNCPDCEDLFPAVVRTGDAYALDSILSALENAGRQDLLSKIRMYVMENEEAKIEKDEKSVLKHRTVPA